MQGESAVLAKAANTEAICTNDIRLAQKRMSDEWDGCATEILRLEGAAALAGIRAIRAEAEQDALRRRAARAQAEVITRLVGVLARTNAMSKLSAGRVLLSRALPGVCKHSSNLTRRSFRLLASHRRFTLQVDHLACRA